MSDGICIGCVAGRWGPECDLICNQHCTQTGEICDVSNANCLSGCVQETWFTGDTCDIIIREYNNQL